MRTVPILLLGALALPSAHAATAPTAVGTLADLRVQERTGHLAVPAAAAFAGDGLSYALVAPLAGVAIDAASGVVVIDSAAGRRHAAAVAVRASNAGGAATQTFALTIGPQVGFAIPDGEYGGAAQRAAIIARLKALGVRWVRTDLRWSVVEATAKGSYDLAAADALVDLARANGIEVLWVVHGTPAWARPSGGAAAGPPADLADWRDFLTAMVGHFSGARSVRHWEIWNEPNLNGFWRGTYTPAQFAAVHNAAYDAIKAADPGATVISAGLSSVPSTDAATPPAYVGAKDFLAAMYAAGLRTRSDAIGMHPYSRPFLPGSTLGYTGFEIMRSGIQAQLKTANADAAKPIWITEFGAPTNVASGAWEAMSEDDQRRSLEEAFDLCAGYAWAGPIFWYGYQDRGGAAADPENWYGAFRPDGSAKPVAAAFAALRTGSAPPAVSAATATPSPVAGTTAALAATAADDGDEAALTYAWSATGPAAVAFSAGGSNAARNATATFARAGAYVLTVTATDAGGLSASRSVALDVAATATAVTVAPASAEVAAGGTVAFAATVHDQFGAAMAAAPAWSVAGGGTIDAAGVFTAGAAAGGPYAVGAAVGAAAGTAQVGVAAAAGGSTSAGSGSGGSGGCGAGAAGLLLALAAGLLRRRPAA